jgi:alpha-amylase/alpha-mannosidase (GH57 family)
VLLEQIADYAEQIEVWLDTGKRIRDPLLAALAGPGLPLDMQGRRALILACMRANDHHLINRFPVFRELVGMAKCGERDQHSAMYFSDQFLVDLLVWYHLAWMGESVRENDLRIASLEKKQRGYTNDDRRHLMAVIGEQVASIIPRYRQLAEEGRVELSVTPYAHPVVPLLIDIESAREAMPEMHLPELQAYPGGEARARWHIRKGVETFERHFGFRPKGCWPSEGGVCEETLRMLEEEGFVWAASGQQVLHNSMMVSARGAPVHEPWLHSAYRVHEGKLNCFFRDDGLSDLIGFTYADWHADDAVGNLVQHLENIAALSADDPDAVVSIILDGENAWEYYPFNGSYFLSALYRRLAQHPDLELTTFSECIAAQTAQPPALNRLVAGSWVYGTFSTWIGDPDKNRAWDMLGEAKRAYDRVIESGRLSPEQRREVEIQLSTCEGSDWFWWFGDYNPADTVSDFEGLYRRQLSHLYLMLGEPQPDYLGQVFARGSGAPTMGGVMKRN